MLELSIYLFIAFLSIIFFTPKTNFAVLKYSFLIPFTISSIYLIDLYALNKWEFNTWYVVGMKFKPCILPTLICGLVIYFHLKKQINKNIEVKFPKILFISIIITASLGLFQKSLIKPEKIDPEKETALEFINYSVIKLKQRLPLEITKDLYLNNVEYDAEENSIFYTYQDFKADVNELNLTEKDIKQSEEAWKNMFLRISKKSDNKEAYITANTPLNYEIIDKNDKTIVKFTITPNDYE